MQVRFTLWDDQNAPNLYSISEKKQDLWANDELKYYTSFVPRATLWLIFSVIQL